jgi:hypothetical protein
MGRRPAPTAIAVNPLNNPVNPDRDTIGNIHQLTYSSRENRMRIRFRNTENKKIKRIFFAISETLADWAPGSLACRCVCRKEMINILCFVVLYITTCYNF